MDDSVEAGSDDHGKGPAEAGRRGRAPRLPALQRAGSVLDRVGRAAGRLAIASAVSAAVLWWTLRLVAGEGRGTLLAVAAVLLLSPPVVLMLFYVAVRTLLSLPRRMGEVPAALRERGEHIRRRADAVARRRGGIPWAVSLLRLWWSIASSRDVLRVVSPAAVLLTPWMLVAAVVAGLAAAIEVVAGIVAVIWLAG